jgi:hypothetical protein
VNGLGLIVGGVRLVQTRLAPGRCALRSDPLDEIYGITCYNEDSSSTDPDFGDASQASAYGVSSAFVASNGGDPAGSGVFEWVISTNSTLVEAQTQVTGLSAAYWLDEATRSVGVQFAVLNGAAGLWAWVSMKTEFTRGGRGSPSYHVAGVPVEP